MEFDKQFCILMNLRRYTGAFQNPSDVYAD